MAPTTWAPYCTWSWNSFWLMWVLPRLWLRKHFHSGSNYIRVRRTYMGSKNEGNQKQKQNKEWGEPTKITPQEKKGFFVKHIYMFLLKTYSNLNNWLVHAKPLLSFYHLLEPCLGRNKDLVQPILICPVLLAVQKQMGAPYGNINYAHPEKW